jgi:hypothetical protein
MRTFAVAVMFGVSACASVPNENDISVRTASWQGASAAELVAVLGQPDGRTKRGTWVWQFAGPERRVHNGHWYSPHYSSTTTLSVIQACPGCPPGQNMTRSGYRPTGTVIARGICTYLGYVEGGVVAKITTLSEPGTHCDFEDLPLRPTE